MKLLNKNKMLAKDIIFLGIDDQFLFNYPIYKFLQKYYSSNPNFKRAGIIRQGFAI